MQYWRTYAYINNNTVKNICVFEPNGAYTYANDAAHEEFGASAFAVDVTQIPVAINDVYSHGKFYRNEEEIIPLPTDEEQILSLNEQIATAQSDMTDVQIALVELYERSVE